MCYVANPTQSQTQRLFHNLHAKDKHIFLYLTNIAICMGKALLIKNHCIRDWNNLKKDLLDIPDSQLSLSKIKNLSTIIVWSLGLLNFLIFIIIIYLLLIKCWSYTTTNTKNNIYIKPSQTQLQSFL